MDRSWLTPLAADRPCLVFVHGFLSSAERCWAQENGPSWPEMVRASFPQLAVCEVTYNTAVWSGHYSISDVADSLHERLGQDGVLTPGRRLLFVCHSMGGLVVRRLLVKRREELAEIELSVGLFLVASPSLGSDYARWFRPILRFLGHSQGEAMRFSESNAWLLDLDRDFQQLLERGAPEIVGRELIEDRLVVLPRLWFLRRVVPAFSAARYFPEPLKIAGSDHFSIAAPADGDSLQHGALCQLVQGMTGLVPFKSGVRVFLSYRHCDPDKGLALALARAFGAAGYDTFLDLRLNTGMAWQEEIARELERATHFVVLLSQESAASEMVRWEIAHAHRRRQRGECEILPMRVAFEGPLPTELAAILDPIQQAHWTPARPADALVQELLAALRGGTWAPLPEPAEKVPLPRHVMGTPSGAPMPRADVGALLASGAQAADAALYVRRAADEELEAELGAPFTALVSGPRQSGKSSLLARAMAQLLEKGQQVVYLDLQQADGEIFASFTAWAFHLARQLHRQTGRGKAPNAADFGVLPMSTLTEFVEDQILAGQERPLALVLDEVDRFFGKATGLEVFSLLRGWHNNRAQKPALWRQLSLLLAHSTQPYLWIPDDDRSPFNVGTRLRLGDFTLEEVRSLTARLAGVSLADEDLAQLVALTGGQPYLTRLALHYVLTSGGRHAGLEAQQAAGEAGIFGDHLRAIGYNLHKKPELIPSLQQVLAEGRCRDEKHFLRLLAAGLVRGNDPAHVEIHRTLYRAYFAALR